MAFFGPWVMPRRDTCKCSVRGLKSPGGQAPSPPAVWKCGTHGQVYKKQRLANVPLHESILHLWAETPKVQVVE